MFGSHRRLGLASVRMVSSLRPDIPRYTELPKRGERSGEGSQTGEVVVSIVSSLVVAFLLFEYPFVVRGTSPVSHVKG